MKHSSKTKKWKSEKVNIWVNCTVQSSAFEWGGGVQVCVFVCRIEMQTWFMFVVYFDQLHSQIASQGVWLIRISAIFQAFLFISKLFQWFHSWNQHWKSLEMNKKAWKTAEKNVLTSFWVSAAPKSWSKYTTCVCRIECLVLKMHFYLKDNILDYMLDLKTLEKIEL